MKCDECVDEQTCGIRLAMKEVRDATAHILDNTSLVALNTQVARARRAGSHVEAPVTLAGVSAG